MLPSAAPAIEVEHLRRSYGDHVVLDDVSLTVPAGSVYALLGPNGAGKTTLVSTLATLLRPDSGTARVAGYDVVRSADAVRDAIGVTGQLSAVDDLLTGTENLRLMADLLHLPRAEGRRRAAELLELFGLTESADRTAATYSGGMTRKLDLAMTLVGGPSVIYLDEPSTGLDPRSRRELWDIVREIVADGTTILLTTQYLEEADQLADTVGVLDCGRIVAEGTPAELKRRVPGGHVRVGVADPAQLDAVTRAFPDAVRDDATLSARIPSGDELAAVRGVLDRLEDAGVTSASISVETPDLDEVFLSLTRPAGATASVAKELS
ncbi:daunorubicin resistance protein DrrA family ABC transporter ATP-binding protein [Luteimicrobium album]|uniref:Daunorubicin resistance protein DrrA family ABC transporter ATP-binding protein n=1 Tax=Luteimicrobium album TaxID=1054550 RepID=A0ABQ6I162_9MICO|nr:ATP-binding cassette domain-containing protein [Luteimicrobium album]GMA23957.1 daunorubicin resistance protein DrrA family ABC transporter ATP-binding protein [Luteimicrobium album]